MYLDAGKTQQVQGVSGEDVYHWGGFTYINSVKPEYSKPCTNYGKQLIPAAMTFDRLQGTIGMTSTLATPFSSTQFAMYIVMNPMSSGDAGDIIGATLASSDQTTYQYANGFACRFPDPAEIWLDYEVILQKNTGNTKGLSSNATDPNLTALNHWHMYEMHWETTGAVATGTYYMNGQDITEDETDAAVADMNWDTVYLGCAPSWASSSPASTYGSAHIAEVMIYDTTHSISQRNTMREYLFNKWLPDQTYITEQ
jgi:hypothetical protein